MNKVIENSDNVKKLDMLSGLKEEREALSSLKKEIIPSMKDATKEDLKSLALSILKTSSQNKDKLDIDQNLIDKFPQKSKKISDKPNSNLDYLVSKSENYTGDVQIKAGFNMLATKFGVQKVSKILQDIDGSGLTIKNPADKGRIESIISFYSSIPNWLQSFFLS